MLAAAGQVPASLAHTISWKAEHSKHNVLDRAPEEAARLSGYPTAPGLVFFFTIGMDAVVGIKE